MRNSHSEEELTIPDGVKVNIKNRYVVVEGECEIGHVMQTLILIT